MKLILKLQRIFFFFDAKFFTTTNLIGTPICKRAWTWVAFDKLHCRTRSLYHGLKYPSLVVLSRWTHLCVQNFVECPKKVLFSPSLKPHVYQARPDVLRRMFNFWESIKKKLTSKVNSWCGVTPTVLSEIMGPVASFTYFRNDMHVHDTQVYNCAWRGTLLSYSSIL